MSKTHKRRLLAASAAALSSILHIKAIAFLLAFSECKFSCNGRSRLGLQALICNNGGSGVPKFMPCVRQQGQLGERIQHHCGLAFFIRHQAQDILHEAGCSLTCSTRADRHLYGVVHPPH